MQYLNKMRVMERVPYLLRSYQGQIGRHSEEVE